MSRIKTKFITDNAVTDAKIRQSGATSVVGRSANSTGNVADIAASADGQVLQRTAGALSFGAPAFYRAGQQSISSASTSQAITFSSTLGSTNYAISVIMKNVTDSDPQYQTLEIVAKSATGFTVQWNAPTSTANYVLEWTALPNV